MSNDPRSDENALHEQAARLLQLLGEESFRDAMPSPYAEQESRSSVSAPPPADFELKASKESVPSTAELFASARSSRDVAETNRLFSEAYREQEDEWSAASHPPRGDSWEPEEAKGDAWEPDVSSGPARVQPQYDPTSSEYREQQRQANERLSSSGGAGSSGLPPIAVAAPEPEEPDEGEKRKTGVPSAVEDINRVLADAIGSGGTQSAGTPPVTLEDVIGSDLNLSALSDAAEGTSRQLEGLSDALAAASGAALNAANDIDESIAGSGAAADAQRSARREANRDLAEDPAAQELANKPQSEWTREDFKKWSELQGDWLAKAGFEGAGDLPSEEERAGWTGKQWREWSESQPEMRDITKGKRADGWHTQWDEDDDVAHVEKWSPSIEPERPPEASPVPKKGMNIWQGLQLGMDVLSGNWGRVAMQLAPGAASGAGAGAGAAAGAGAGAAAAGMTAAASIAIPVTAMATAIEMAKRAVHGMIDTQTKAFEPLTGKEEGQIIGEARHSAVNFATGGLPGMLKETALLPRHIMEWDQALIQSKEHIAAFNGNLQAAFQEAEIRELQRGIGSAQVVGGPVSELSSAFQDLKDSLLPTQTAVTVTLAMLLTEITKIGTFLVEVWNGSPMGMIVELLNKIGKNTTPEQSVALDSFLNNVRTYYEPRPPSGRNAGSNRRASL